MTTTADGQKLLMQQRIDRDPAAAFRVLVAIWERQSEGEKFTHVYDPREGGKGEGFSPRDTPDANALYERYKEAGFRWQHMTAIDVVRCQRLMNKYATQYLKTEVDARERDIQRFKINKHEPRPKLDQSQRERLMANVQNMTELPG